MTRMTKSILTATPFALAGAYGFFYYQNHRIDTTHYTIKSTRLPDGFDGATFLQISDFHNTAFGADSAYIIKKVAKLSPDYILITGDLIDKRRTTLDDMDVATSFIGKIAQIAPVYFAQGNHEAVSIVYPELLKALRKHGVHILENKTATLTRKGDGIKLVGIKDIAVYEDNTEISENFAQSLIQNTKDTFHILLAHRPHLIANYLSAGADLVFSGHAHGGQVRLPCIGGLYAPGQGVFPKLTSGVHDFGTSKLIVSRGLGNSSGPLRVFNHPELVVVTLKKSKKRSNNTE